MNKKAKDAGLIMMICMVLISMFIPGCSSTKEHTNFRMAKKSFTLPENSLLKTYGVYIYTYQVRDTTYFDLLRFFRNGRCFYATFVKGDPYAILSGAAKFPPGTNTYYRCEGDKLTYEIWGGGYTGYIYVYAQFNDERLYETGYKPRGFTTSKMKYPQTRAYEFRPFGYAE